MKVRDVLNTKGNAIYSIRSDATVSDAVAKMVHHNIGSMPIIEGDGQLVGIFTERDVLRGMHKDCEGFGRSAIREMMTRNPVTCELDDDVHEVMGKMSEFRVGQLPVMLNAQLVGLVSIGDVVKILYEKVEAENRHLLAYIHGSV